MREKGFVLSLVLVILALGVIAGGVAIFQLKSKLTPQPQPPQAAVSSPIQATSPAQKDETANWKTYVSPNNVFTLKYPPQLYETKQYISNLSTGWKDEGVLSTTKPWNETMTKDSDILIEFSLRMKHSSEKLEDFISRTIKEQGGEFYSPESVIPDEKKKVQVDNRGSLWYVGNLGPAVKHVEVYVPQSDTEVIVIALWDNAQPPSLNHQRILHQILSTFKFLD